MNGWARSAFRRPFAACENIQFRLPNESRALTFAPRPLPFLLILFLAQPAAAQAPPPADAGRLAFFGDTTRAAIGWDSDNRLRGELWHVLREDERTAWIGELWATDRSAGGAKLSYHWRGDADAGVRKAFVAFDQNRWHDRKVTLGGGYETERWFASGYASAGVTGRREVGFEESSTAQTILGVDNGRPYAQDVTTTLTTRTFERAYDWGVGGRIGHFYAEPLLRVEAGLDYERGRNSTGQATVSLAAEKFFAGTPHSVGVAGEAYRKHGGIEPDRDDARVWLTYRYAFGGSAAWRSEQSYRMVEVPRAVPVAASAAAEPSVAPAPAASPAPSQPRMEKRIVKTTATASADAFFALDSAMLRPEAKAALDVAVARIKAAGFEGNVRVAGHTCDLGSAAYNLRLSQRRADAVRGYFVAQGLPAARVLAEGLGESAPRHPNTPASRPLNRRVDIEFVTFEDKVETVAVVSSAPPVAAAPTQAKPAPAPATPAASAVEWRREEIATEPAWLRRALRSSAGHKQTVDVYRTTAETTTVLEGPKRYLNRNPIARNDASTVPADATAQPIAVLGNDDDPDGDPLTIASVGTPAHGTVTISGVQVLYTPARGYTGADAFSYTASDGKGGTATAMVAVAVVRANRAPVARDDYAVAGYNQPVDVDVLANDSDPDGDRLTVLSFTQPQFGTVTRGPGSTLTYRSARDYIGYESFTYEVSDGKGGSARATVVVYADP
jgi:outer membrane protein OmpA-like peptidoglycan-associated protein